jgi:hypothetical protein
MGINYTAYEPPAWARRLIADAAEILRAAGYTVEPFGDDGTLHHITKEA